MSEVIISDKRIRADRAETEAMRGYAKWSHYNFISDKEMWHWFNTHHTDEEWRRFYSTFYPNVSEKLWKIINDIEDMIIKKESEFAHIPDENRLRFSGDRDQLLEDIKTLIKEKLGERP